MSLDYDDLLLSPIYDDDDGPACNGVLILGDSAGTSYAALPDGSPLRLIDHTSGLAVQQPARGSTLTIETIKPVAYMRRSSLAALGLALTDLEGASLTIVHSDTGGVDVTWGIRSYQDKPTPSGPGEIEIILTDRE
jgi:hypothetical protein